MENLFYELYERGTKQILSCRSSYLLVYITVCPYQCEKNALNSYENLMQIEKLIDTFEKYRMARNYAIISNRSDS